MIKFMVVTENIELSRNDFKKLKDDFEFEFKEKYNLKEIYSNDLQLVIDMELNSLSYSILFEIDYCKRYLNCQINNIVKNKTVNYDKNLEKIKLFSKNKLKEMMKAKRNKIFKIIWLEDTQVLELSRNLYFKIHKVESLLRSFIDVSMIKNIGYNWWNEIVSDEIKFKYKKREGDYHFIEKDLNDIKTELFSIDVDDLIEILETKIRKLEIHNLTESYRTEIEEALKKKNKDKVFDLIDKKFELELDIWDKYYKKYFPDTFKNDWKIFYKYRNHIAHNKLITFKNFEILKSKLEELEKIIQDAIDNFNYETLPEDVKMEIEEDIKAFEEIEEFNQKKHERYIKEVESGVEILFSNEIEERIEEFLSNELMKIEELFYLRNDIEIDINAINFENDNVKILEVKSKINENSLEFFINNIDIDEAEGGESSLDLNIHRNNKLYKVLNIRYQNGEAEWDEFQSNYIPLKENGIITDNYLEQFEELNEELNELFPNLIDEIALRAFENIKDGGIGVVSDLECDECGGEYLSINDSFLPIGTCASCGEKHSIIQCNTCGSYYKIEGESVIPDMCENCYEHKLEKF